MQIRTPRLVESQVGPGRAGTDRQTDIKTLTLTFIQGHGPGYVPSWKALGFELQGTQPNLETSYLRAWIPYLLLFLSNMYLIVILD